MLEAEYIRNCNCNYQRIGLKEKPEDRRYQYCILNRGGIRCLLPCSLRYIDNKAYLYYDISSTQNLLQVFGEKKISREWMKDFLWGIRQLREELDRFLLEEANVIWNPQHLFLDLEKNDFFFLSFSLRLSINFKLAMAYCNAKLIISLRERFESVAISSYCFCNDSSMRMVIVTDWSDFLVIIKSCELIFITSMTL